MEISNQITREILKNSERDLFCLEAGEDPDEGGHDQGEVKRSRHFWKCSTSFVKEIPLLSLWWAEVSLVGGTEALQQRGEQKGGSTSPIIPNALFDKDSFADYGDTQGSFMSKVFFNWCPPKNHKFFPVSKFWHWELFWWDLLCNLTLRIFRGVSVKNHPVTCIVPSTTKVFVFHLLH